MFATLSAIFVRQKLPSFFLTFLFLVSFVCSCSKCLPFSHFFCCVEFGFFFCGNFTFLKVQRILSMTCVVCKDRLSSTKAFLCNHTTCKPCAQELCLRRLSCPQCRRENVTNVDSSLDLSFIIVTMNIGTEMQTPGMIFGIPSTVQRELRLLRRTNYEMFEDALMTIADTALFQHGHIV